MSRAHEILARRSGAEPLTRLEVERLRADFPILHQKVYGKPLIYLDNAATTQKPRAVIDTISRFYASDYANVHRGIYQLAERATRAYEEARERVRRFLNARDSREIVFVRGTTEAINLVATSFGEVGVKQGDEILITAMEHHSNIVPWQLLCQRRGARLRVVPINDHGELLVDELERLLGERTRLLALVHVSNALGTVNPVREIVEVAHRRGVPVLVDGAQAVARLPVDVQELGCDFYAFSGHKVYGPSGIGALYGRFERLQKMAPYQGGGEMIASVSFEKTTYADVPAKFEAGTPAVADAVGLAAALDYVDGIGLERIGGSPLLRPRGGPSPRRGNDPRPRGTRRPSRAPLRPARDGALRRPGHPPRLARPLQPTLRDRRPRRRTPSRATTSTRGTSGSLRVGTERRTASTRCAATR
jgi:cysteine desulfurase/selenocysteine lyase